ncbi:MAG TPA: FKBP-type peptidyl-prolyl cis-trans isomerase [Vicinamibacterales bacterium]|nr:FKBP-type peptidyl-prolyl cis-trans isomerase [Vicinamibacterales bacterium]
MMRRLCAVLFVAAAIAGCGGQDSTGIPADAQRTSSGIAWKQIKAGTGTEHPTPTSRVVVHYTGWTMDGKEFDSSVRKGKPLDYPLNRLIPGWIEGVQLMVKGEKRKFWIPGQLAYDGIAGRPQGTLVFEIELLDFK